MQPQNPLPVLGQLNITEEPKLRNDLLELQGFMPNALRDYNSLLKASGTMQPSTVAGTYFLYCGQVNFIVAQAIASTSLSLSMDGFTYRWQPSFWGIPAGSQLNLRLKCNYTTSAASIGAVNFTVDLVTITTVDFTTGTGVARIGGFSGVAGSSFVISSPPASTFGSAVSSDFTAPASGMIAVRLVSDAAMAALSHINLTVELQKRVV